MNLCLKKKLIQWSLEGCTRVFESEFLNPFLKRKNIHKPYQKILGGGVFTDDRCFVIYHLLCLGPCELFSMAHLDWVEKPRFICQSQRFNKHRRSCNSHGTAGMNSTRELKLSLGKHVEQVLLCGPQT